LTTAANKPERDEKPIFSKDIGLNSPSKRSPEPGAGFRELKKNRDTDLEIDIVSPYIITRQKPGRVNKVTYASIYRD
jgi:hypothetical protein